MSLAPNLRIIVDGDSTRVYRRGDKVTGRVILLLEEQETIKSLKVSFVGTCTTKTTRPFYISGNDADARKSRREHDERIRLFTFEQDLLPRGTFAPRKYSWTFDFKFPDLTKPQYSRWAHGTKYLREPHPLPPSFHVRTNTPGGQASVSYCVHARLVRSGSKAMVKTHQMLPYHPSPRDMSLQPRITSRVLYAQIWKPLAGGRTPIDKAFSKLRRTSTSNSNPRIIPTLHYPEKISPGQNIPLLLLLANTQGPSSNSDLANSQCLLDTMAVTISTYTTFMCGQPASQPEDTFAKHVTCLSKTDMNQPLAFGTPFKLTNNFCLVDDAECVPSFRTYTIVRRYELIVVVGIKFGDSRFTIRSTTPLEILPRIPPELLPSAPHEEEVDIEPLPLYVPREPSKEFAPSYEALYSLSRTPSSSGSFAYTESSSSSVSPGSSASISGASTPMSELEQPTFANWVTTAR